MTQSDVTQSDTRSTAPREEPLTIIAKLRAKPGSEQEVFDACHALLGPTRAEDGCINYDMHRSSVEPGTIMFYENWTTRPAWDAHMKSPHLTAFSAATADTVELWEVFQGEQIPE